MRVLALSGSLRRESLNTALLRAAAARLPAGVDLVSFERLAEVPPYDEDVEAAGVEPEAVAELREAVRRADAVLVATPEYNSSIPGQLKNALDWLSRPAGESALRGKPTAVIGASTGMFGAVWAQAETRKVLGAMGGRVVEGELAVARADDLLVDGSLELPPEARQRLDELLSELSAEASPSGPGGQHEEGDRGEVGRRRGDHQQVKDLVVSEDAGVRVRALRRVDDRPGHVEQAARGDQQRARHAELRP
jgi:chromate reductase, NAD(P)H dehydrogenase (quinone)